MVILESSFSYYLVRKFAFEVLQQTISIDAHETL